MAVARGDLQTDQLLLVGRAEDVGELLVEYELHGVDVLDARDVIGMDESPAAAIRTKRESSIARGMSAVAEGKADAFVSAGNTGAVVAAASLLLGRLEGVNRPGIAVPVPTSKGPGIVIDVGANIYCKPRHLAQYAIMATEYAKGAMGKPSPTVGLLNIGEEAGKGNPLIQETHVLLQALPVDYRGFVEGQDITGGAVDVVVCEGFVGNVILKVAEGLGVFMRELVHTAFSEHPPRVEVVQAVASAFTRLDYAEYGGAPLLGVSAPVIIGHGRSSGHAMMNMIRAAVSSLAYDVNRHIVNQLHSLPKETGA